MKTNDIFNFRRFVKYFGSDIRTCRANIGLSLLTISLLFPIAVYLITTAFSLFLNATWEGPGTIIRTSVFGVAMLCITVSLPAKCYGKLTEKQYGSFWLTLPASRLEKFISMVIMTCIITPAAGAALYLGMDAVICAIDHTCGNNLLSAYMDWIGSPIVTINMMNESIEVENAALIQDFVNQVNSPLLYIDEIFVITLPFLLGAICFKNGKNVKTCIAIFVISIPFCIMAVPLMSSWVNGLISYYGNDDAAVVEGILKSGFSRHLVLIDTISDLLVNSALLIGIWFRIKTLKH
jgi:hypothetical protein